MDKEDFYLGAISPSSEHQKAYGQRKKKAEKDWDNTQVKVNRVRARENAHHLLQEVDVPVAQ
jgi:hypothetical protein